MLSSFADINNLTNTTITKVPAVRAVTAKTVENLPHNLLKHEDYPPGFGGGSAILDTYLQYIGENVFGKCHNISNIKKLKIYFKEKLSKTVNFVSLKPVKT